MNTNKENKTQIHVFSPTEVKEIKKKRESGLKKIFTAAGNKLAKLFNKGKKVGYGKSPYTKEVQNLWREFRKTIVGGAATFVLVIALCFVVNMMEWSLGYEVIVDGRNIGMVTDKQAVYQAIEQVRGDVKSYMGDDAVYEKDPIFVRRIVSGKDLADAEELRNALLSSVDFMVEGYGVYIDGKLAFGVSDPNAAELVFDRYKQKYAGMRTGDMTVDFCEKVEVKKEYLGIGILETPENALEVIEGNGKPMLSVKTVQTVAYVEPIPYEVEKVNDANVYKGRVVVSREGKDGEASVVAVVTKVNGVETDKKVVKSETTTKPVTQIEKIGTKTPPPTTGSGVFVKPTYGVLTSRYGARWNRQHKGIDIGGSHNSPILAADGGVVTYAGWMSGYGNYVVIDHENGYKTAYGHCNSIGVTVGARVIKGEEIAKMGNTGRSTGTHLHFEVIKDGTHVNPLEYVGY